MHEDTNPGGDSFTDNLTGRKVIRYAESVTPTPMNAARRKAIAEILDRLEAIKTDLEAARDEEQEYYDNMPESIQAGQKGDDAQTAIDAMESAANSVDEAASELQSLGVPAQGIKL